MSLPPPSVNLILPAQRGHAFLKLFSARLHLLACKTCHNRKSVSYIVIPKLIAPACGTGEGVGGGERPTSLKAAWQSTDVSLSGCPPLSPPQTHAPKSKCQKSESIARHCFSVSGSWWWCLLFFFNKAFE